MQITHAKLWGGMALVVILSISIPAAQAGEGVEVRHVTRMISISSDHPYWNSEALSWPVGEMGAMACRVNFSRLETEGGYDFVILNSSYDEASLNGSYAAGCWSDWVVGTSFTLRLVTNSYNTDYGFDAVAYEIQVSAARESFWLVAIPVLVGLAAVIIVLEVRARRRES